MRSWTRAALLPAGLCLVVLGLGVAPLPASAQVELSMSAWVPPSHMLVKDGMVPWMKEVERVTDGRVKVKLLPKPVTNPINHFDAVRDGLADVAFVSHAYTPARFQLVRVGVLPFSGDNAEVNSVALWRIYSKHFLKQDEHKGVKLLTIYTHGPGIFWNAKKPIKTIDDFAGLKIRVGGTQADMLNSTCALAGSGATPSPSPTRHSPAGRRAALVQDLIALVSSRCWQLFRRRPSHRARTGNGGRGATMTPAGRD